jgi:spore coat polysaccharide biosynthesis protein SpsF (cytidylyltransferase family)
MIAAIILVRLDSKRFPHKALAKLGGVRLIESIIQTLLEDKFFIPIIATTNRLVDEPLVEVANFFNIDIFRGDLENISRRVIDCLKVHNIKYFARINGDSPFIRLDLLKEGAAILEKNNYDFVTNLYPRSFPYGMSVEIFKSDFFIESMDKISDPRYMENITSYFYDNISKFKYKNISMENGKNYQNIRLTVDTTDDLDLIQRMINLDKFIFKRDVEEIVSIYEKVNNKLK